MNDISQNWVPVKDRLPEARVRVLLTDGKQILLGVRNLYEDDESCCIWSCVGMYGYNDGGWDFDEDEIVTHWHPIPELPIH